MLFGWRKRSEGFEWREYVRTTILVRRADRQRRIDDARLAALGKVKDARDRGIDAGLRQVQMAKGGAVGLADAGLSAARGLTGRCLSAMMRSVTAAASAMRGAAARLPMPRTPAVARRIAADAVLYGSDLPRRWRIAKPYLLPLGGLAAAVFVFATALAPTVSGNGSPGAGPLTTASIDRAPASTTDGAPAAVTGRATVVSGDLIRIGSQLIRLEGIEAPAEAQPCFKANGRRWSCASSAATALKKAVRGQRISCQLRDQSSGGPVAGVCQFSGTDIAADLLRKGHVFAAETAPSNYRDHEDEAHQAKLGIWQGVIDRPEAWRGKLWDDAKAAAPNGCPIKGVVKSGARVYAMPWTAGYAGRTIREPKGERWFCSEDEAQAAGFYPSTAL